MVGLLVLVGLVVLGVFVVKAVRKGEAVVAKPEEVKAPAKKAAKSKSKK